MEIKKEMIGHFPQIIAFHVGKAQMIKHGNKEVPSAIYKALSHKQHAINATGVEGDEQGDKVNHGGIDKAICVYLEESYKHWEQIGHPLTFGAFGENMTISQLREDTVRIGDTYRIGSVVVQVSQPRQPCFKLGIRNDWPELLQLSKQSGYTGFYLRVIEEGKVGAGMELEMINQAQHSFSIKEANRVMYSKQSTLEELKQLAAIEELADAWKHSLAKRIEKLA